MYEDDNEDDVFGEEISSDPFARQNSDPFANDFDEYNDDCMEEESKTFEVEDLQKIGVMRKTQHGMNLTLMNLTLAHIVILKQNTKHFCLCVLILFLFLSSPPPPPLSNDTLTKQQVTSIG